MNAETTIAPTDLRDYLRTTGWSLREDALADRLYVMENARHPRRQMVFPMDTNAPDYRESVLRVCNKVAELMDIRLDSLISRIEELGDDVLRLRVSFDGNDSSLPLSFAGMLVQNTEKLLKAAACTALRPRMHHPRLSLSEASQLVERARFQQTEKGSFVLKVACPIHALEVQGGLLAFDDGNTPFVRQATLALQKSLVMLTSAIETDTLDKMVDELKASREPIISSNLCEAVAGMYDDAVRNSVDISFDWSMLHAVPESVKSSARIRVQRDYFSRIDQVRRELRAVESTTDDTFIGTVERLDGEINDDGRRSGDVMLAILLPDEGETVRAKLSLDAGDYEKAITAHRSNGAYVRLVGRLRPGRQPRQLTNVTRFELLGAAQTA
jgi:hypothetical protein